MKIEIEDLFYLYEESKEKVVALRGMHLTIPSRECLVIKGPNGSGKSTLVKILSGFLRPSAGRVLLDGIDISRIDPLKLRREFIATIDQKGNLLPDLSIKENMELALRLAGESPDVATEYASQLLRDNELGNFLHAYPSQLSAGERQICAVLVALARSPKVLIADEPSGELDNEAADKVYALLKSFATTATVLLVTHDSRAEAYADRIVRVRDGRVSAQWQPEGNEEPVIDPFGWMQVAAAKTIKSGAQIQSPRTNLESAPLIRLKELSLRYGNRELFSHINSEIWRGDLVAVVGSSGSGKSSLLRIIAGLQLPTSGGVTLHQTDFNTLTRAELAHMRFSNIAYLEQGDSPVGALTVREYFEGKEFDGAEDFVPRMSRKLSQFSGGERARIEIYKMLSLSRSILILDEPTSQLDERQSAGITELIIAHVNNGGIAIVSTRDESISTIATQTIRLN